MMYDFMGHMHRASPTSQSAAVWVANLMMKHSAKGSQLKGHNLRRERLRKGDWNSTESACQHAQIEVPDGLSEVEAR